MIVRRRCTGQIKPGLAISNIGGLLLLWWWWWGGVCVVVVVCCLFLYFPGFCNTSLFSEYVTHLLISG